MLVCLRLLVPTLGSVVHTFQTSYFRRRPTVWLAVWKIRASQPHLQAIQPLVRNMDHLANLFGTAPDRVAAEPEACARTPRTREFVAPAQQEQEAGSTLLPQLARRAPPANVDREDSPKPKQRPASMDAVLDPEFRLEHNGRVHPEIATWQPGKDEQDETLRFHFWATATAAACGPNSLYQFKVNPGLLATTKTGPVDGNAMYIALVIPVNDLFLRSSRLPLLAKTSHMSISYATLFDTWEAYWKFKILASSLLCERVVSCRFLATSSCRRFAIDPSCELWSLGLLIRNLAMQHGKEIEVWENLDLHITWHKGV